MKLEFDFKVMHNMLTIIIYLWHMTELLEIYLQALLGRVAVPCGVHQGVPGGVLPV
jgi:hypothetical protein